MIADPLTKRMRADRLVEILATGKSSSEPTPEAILAKMSKQKSRRKGEPVEEKELTEAYRPLNALKRATKNSSLTEATGGA